MGGELDSTVTYLYVTYPIMEPSRYAVGCFGGGAIESLFFAAVILGLVVVNGGLVMVIVWGVSQWVKVIVGLLSKAKVVGRKPGDWRW